MRKGALATRQRAELCQVKVGATRAGSLGSHAGVITGQHQAWGMG